MASGLAAAMVPGGAIADDARIPTASLLQDAAIFERAYTTLHPGLLRYNTLAEMQARFAALRAAFTQPRTLAEAHLAFARVTAAIRCGHSFLNPANQEGASLTLLSSGRTRLPFRFRWIDQRMIVSDGAASAPSLTPGMEILSIGGMPGARLLQALLPLAHADGHNDAARTRQMDARGDEQWPAFNIYAPMLHPELFAAGSTRVTTREVASGREQTFEVPLLRHGELASPGDLRFATDPSWRLEHPATGVAWLAMPSWAVFDSKQDWRGSLHAMIDSLAADNMRALVVDLRGNIGGLDVGDVILSHIVERDLAKTDLRRRVRYRRTPPDLDPYLKTWDRSFRDWGSRAVGPDAAGFYALEKPAVSDDADLIVPHGRRFTGRLIVIIDASNASATFGFAQMVRNHALGTLVGETTGGSRRGINGGGFFFLQLPGSGLEIDIPLIGYFPSAPQPDAGIVPDVTVATTASDLADGVDAQRDAALRLALSP